MPDIVTSRTFVDGEKNITAQKLNDIVASSVIQPAFVSAKPSTSTVAPTDNLLVLTAAGGTYAKAPFQTVIDSVNANLNTNAAIWSVRLRSFNGVGNQTFEVDQRNVGNTSSGVTNGSAIQDRWWIQRVGTNAISAGQNSIAGGINLPGTSYAISRSFLRVTLTTAEPTLAAGDAIGIYQYIEGSRWRELQNDVHSFQILARSSVANLVIGISLRDPSTTHSLTNTLTLGAANTWVLLTLPNLPVWTPSGSFVNTSGNVGYLLNITLASGATFMSPANSTWQNGNFVGATGQSNFANSPVNSTFDLAYISHEPGPLCSNPPMDCAFEDNYRSCLRYYQKSNTYSILPNTSAQWGRALLVSATTSTRSLVAFPVEMAKTPTARIWGNGTLNTVYSDAQGGYVAITGPPACSTKFLGNLTLSSAITNATYPILMFDWDADSGW